jgi:hypothetical protein
VLRGYPLSLDGSKQPVVHELHFAGTEDHNGCVVAVLVLLAD